MRPTHGVLPPWEIFNTRQRRERPGVLTKASGQPCACPMPACTTWHRTPAPVAPARENSHLFPEWWRGASRG
ncbi:hypothetical protein D187_005327 [Cystobacter fuscus DSM 2262]|uniref:Uncharacterized protein n=1 Tax=Cystobacter fuscus (strain ATCC 25194 / DSM 2262 / NBRC 100088 / M29) TaxID=1242864 RepID=S9R5G1_CYSF2|nr:hypothetical protein D187_005327 [Cystobacter fuscus DSM 2262]